MRRISLLTPSAPAVLAAVLLSLAACENSSAPRLGAYVLTKVSGDSQRLAVGDPLPAPLRVRLMAGERPVAGVNIHWSTGNLGLLDGGTSRTDRNGYSSMGWTMGPDPGVYHAAAWVPNVGQIDFTATATVGYFARLRLSPDTLWLEDVGDSVLFDVGAEDRFGNAVDLPPVEWRSLSPQVAAVSGAGVVRGVNGGTARIVATSLSQADTAVVVVQQQPASVALVTKSVVIRALHATTPLQANVLDRLGNPIAGAPASWSSLDPLIVSVNANGVATAIAAGTGRVRVAAGAGADTATVVVSQVATRIVMLPATATLPAGSSMLVQPSAYDSLGSFIANPDLSWWSADSTVVRLLGGGWIAGLHMGTVKVYVNAWYQHQVTAVASTTVTVVVGPIVHVTVSPDTATLQVGGTRTFTAVATDSLGNVAGGIAWMSSDSTRATVDQAGHVTARAPGAVLIYATAGGVTGSAAITITALTSGAVVRDPVAVAAGGGRVTRDRVRARAARNLPPGDSRASG